MYEWIASFTRGETAARDGSVISTTFDRTMKSQLDFTNTRIVEVTFPALDAASSTPAFLTVKIQPETSRAKAVTGFMDARGSNQSLWSPGNFVVDIAGLDCSHISGIDAFTVRLVGSDLIGVDLLGFTLTEGTSTTWRSFFNTFVLRLSQRGERAGTVQVRDASLTGVLASMSFGHMGIVALDPLPDSGGPRRVKAQLYCEEISFSAPGTS